MRDGHHHWRRLLHARAGLLLQLLLVQRSGLDLAHVRDLGCGGEDADEHRRGDRDGVLQDDAAEAGEPLRRHDLRADGEAFNETLGEDELADDLGIHRVQRGGGRRGRADDRGQLVAHAAARRGGGAAERRRVGGGRVLAHPLHAEGRGVVARPPRRLAQRRRDRVRRVAVRVERTLVCAEGLAPRQEDDDDVLELLQTLQDLDGVDWRHRHRGRRRVREAAAALLLRQLDPCRAQAHV